MLSEIVRETIIEKGMLRSEEPVVVAVSGGPDSLCLLHVLHQLSCELMITLHVAHLDHMLRGAESAAEARFVADLALEWGLSATIKEIDVRALAQQKKRNLAATARQARYALLARIATTIGAQAVALAHQADDQAETVLLHLLHGTGLEGLRGMRPVVPWEEWGAEPSIPTEHRASSPRPRLIRPLLYVTREQIESYCTDHKLEPRRDPTNTDLHYTRNRIRHDLLPLMKTYNPRIVEALGRSAEIYAQDYAFLQHQLDAIWGQLTSTYPETILFNGDIWRHLHPSLQREALRRGHAYLAPGALLEYKHIEQARKQIARQVGKQVSLPGAVRLTVGYKNSFTLGVPRPSSAPQLSSAEQMIQAPGCIALEDGWMLAATYTTAQAPATQWEVYLVEQVLSAPLVVRRRRPGDRVRPAGGIGSRRLQDLMVDAKIPQSQRDRWPIVATQDEIIWVPGIRAAEGVVAKPATARSLHLRVIPPQMREEANT